MTDQEKTHDQYNCTCKPCVEAAVERMSQNKPPPAQWGVVACVIEDENYIEYSVTAIMHGQRLVVADVTACRDFTEAECRAHAFLIAAAPTYRDAGTKLIAAFGDAPDEVIAGAFGEDMLEGLNLLRAAHTKAAA